MLSLWLLFDSQNCGRLKRKLLPGRRSAAMIMLVTSQQGHGGHLSPIVKGAAIDREPRMSNVMLIGDSFPDFRPRSKS